MSPKRPPKLWLSSGKYTVRWTRAFYRRRLPSIIWFSDGGCNTSYTTAAYIIRCTHLHVDTLCIHYLEIPCGKCCVWGDRSPLWTSCFFSWSSGLGSREALKAEVGPRTRGRRWGVAPTAWESGRAAKNGCQAAELFLVYSRRKIKGRHCPFFAHVPLWGP